MHEATFDTSKPRFAVLLLVCLAFVAMGAFIVAAGGGFWGWASILFFGLCAFVAIRELLRTAPRLTINEEGILDQNLGVGVIRWSDVTDAYLARMQGQPFICLVLQDPEPYLRRLHPIKRRLNRANGAFGFTELSVSLSGLADVEPEAVLELVLAGAEAAHSAEPAENRPRGGSME